MPSRISILFAFLEKHWPVFCLLLLGLLIGALLFYPGIAGGLAGGVSVLCAGLAVAFAAKPRLEAYRQRQITRRELIRLLAFDLTGIALAMGIAILAGTLAGGPTGTVAARVMESRWPGQGARIGQLAGIFAALLAGIGAGVLVHRLWGKMSTNRPRETHKRTETGAPGA